MMSNDNDHIVIRSRSAVIERIEEPAEREELVDSWWLRLSPLLHSELLAGLLLIVATVIALVWANSPWAESYHKIWHTYLGVTFGEFSLKYSLQHWINDLLMALFFFLVGLEIKREIIAGELSSLSKALLPVTAAIGGMVIPALFFLIFNSDSPYQRGWGIPMATDIAFALGILSLFGRRVPLGLKIFLAALAIADDIGAVLVIALFYTEGLEVLKVFNGFAFLGVLIFFNYVGIRHAALFGIVGICGLWLSFLLSGVHPSVAGVLAAFTIPARRKINAPAFLLAVKPQMKTFEQEFRDKRPSQRSPFLDKHQLEAIFNLESAYKAAAPPLQRVENRLHPFISFGIMPLFALANAGVHIDMATVSDLGSPLSLGIIAGLFLGKQLGIFGATWLTVKLGVTHLPSGVNWKMIYGASCLGGVGFTMSLFISTLAFHESPESLEAAKLAILLGSLISAVLGAVVLALCLKQPEDSEDETVESSAHSAEPEETHTSEAHA